MTSNTGLFSALSQALVLTALAVAIGLGTYATSDGPGLTDPVLPSDAATVRTIDIAEAKQLLQTGTAVFLDVREAMDYMDSHLPGAGNLPLEPERQEGKPLTVIVYCSDASCGKAATMADNMRENGLEVVVMPAGAAGWAEQGNSMEMSQ